MTAWDGFSPAYEGAVTDLALASSRPAAKMAALPSPRLRHRGETRKFDPGGVPAGAGLRLWGPGLFSGCGQKSRQTSESTRSALASGLPTIRAGAGGSPAVCGVAMTVDRRASLCASPTCIAACDLAMETRMHFKTNIIVLTKYLDCYGVFV
jgi:hypothetical protein